MSTALVPLAALMGLVTYPARAIPLLAPGLDRLPAAARSYIRLVAPAILSALAVVSTAVRSDAAGHASLHIGAEWLAVGLCIAFVAWRRNLLVGLLLAAGSLAILRATGLAGLP
jgi:branched-subunit amino acid transport protein